MFLLNSDQIKEYSNHDMLSIIPNDDWTTLLPTWYYFRLGSIIESLDERKHEWILHDLGSHGNSVFTIPSKGFLKVWSFEKFKCSNRILALIGQRARLTDEYDLRLHYSPSIDPGFDGYLRLGIENLVNEERTIEFKMTIGKVLFFDISDTYPVCSVEGTDSERDFSTRNWSSVKELSRDINKRKH
ncbi:hypothetical protein IIA79_06080 [bacterium]|nr:hypothetical protein [bacterium]